MFMNDDIVENIKRKWCTTFSILWVLQILILILYYSIINKY